MRTPRRGKPALEFFHSTSRSFPSLPPAVWGLKFVIFRGGASVFKIQTSLGEPALCEKYAVVFPLVLKPTFHCEWTTSVSLLRLPLVTSTVRRTWCVPSTLCAMRCFESGIHSNRRTLAA